MFRALLTDALNYSNPINGQQDREVGKTVNVQDQKSQDPLISHDERRAHPRLIVMADIDVWSVVSDGTDERRSLMAGKLLDLSEGGGRIEIADFDGDKGDLVGISLPLVGDRILSVVGEVCWIIGVPAGKRMGMHFVLLNKRQTKTINKVIEILSSVPGGGSRKHARVAARMAASYGSPVELKAVLEDISKGGMATTIPATDAKDMPELNEIVNFAIQTGEPGGDPLVLSARVVRREAIRIGQGDFTRLHLEFEKLDAETRARVDLLLKSLVGSGTSAE
jgi:hypothetical protein